jgi:glycogen phosphorylase
VDDFLQPMAATCQIEVEGRPVTVHAWRYLLQGTSGAEVLVFFLDTEVPGNDPFDRTLTDHLYGGDERYRPCQ